MKIKNAKNFRCAISQTETFIQMFVCLYKHKTTTTIFYLFCFSIKITCGYSSSRRTAGVYIFKVLPIGNEWNSIWRKDTEEENHKSIFVCEIHYSKYHPINVCINVCIT